MIYLGHIETTEHSFAQFVQKRGTELGPVVLAKIENLVSEGRRLGNIKGSL